MVVQVVYYYILTEKQSRHAIEIADYQQQVAIQQEKQREEWSSLNSIRFFKYREDHCLLGAVTHLKTTSSRVVLLDQSLCSRDEIEKRVLQLHATLAPFTVKGRMGCRRLGQSKLFFSFQLEKVNKFIIKSLNSIKKYGMTAIDQSDCDAGCSFAFLLKCIF